MYESHWNLKRRPFENWSDDALYYPSEVHQTGLLKLRYGVENRRSAAVLCGDSGMGKSILLSSFVDQLPEDFAPIAQVVFPTLPSEQLLSYIADQWTGTTGPDTEPMRSSLGRIEQFLRKNVEAKKHAVLIVDEAHLLTDPQQLETLRLLLNVNATVPEAESAWTLILVGHPSLIGLVEHNQALDGRVSVKCVLQRLSLEQTAGYIQHRLAAVGGDIDAIFSPEAIEAVQLRSSGVPRRINRLCDLGLMVAYAEDQSRIEAHHIEGVYNELVSIPT
ncbi:MAG: AAA family ATPase [Pirellulaceae bacterium]